MTAPTLPLSAEPPRPGSRAARMAMPRALDALKELATEYGVCIRPVALRRTDLATGQTELIDLPCGATREAKCPPCAKRARRLRQAQIREGWHRTDEPDPGPAPATDDQTALIALRAHSGVRPGRGRTRRPSGTRSPTSTTRSPKSSRPSPPRACAAGSPPPTTTATTRTTTSRAAAGPVDPPPAGRARPAPAEGRPAHRRPHLHRPRRHACTSPRMWLTLTLDSYGPVHGVRPRGGRAPAAAGTPDDPSSAPRSTPTLRLPARRLGRGALPPAARPVLAEPAPRRRLERPVRRLRRAATPAGPARALRHPGHRPPGHARAGRGRHLPPGVVAARRPARLHARPAARSGTSTRQRVDRPRHRAPLPTWAEALDAIDADPDAAAGARGPVRAAGQGQGRHRRQQGRRTARSATSPSTSPRPPPTATPPPPTRSATTSTGSGSNCGSPRARSGAPTGCSTASSPRAPTPSCGPATARASVHQKATLGIGGRRVLVSRDWSGKTLADHRADAHAWVRALLGISHRRRPPRPAADRATAAPAPVAWEMARPGDPDLPPLEHRLLRAISNASSNAGNSPPHGREAAVIHHSISRQSTGTEP